MKNSLEDVTLIILHATLSQKGSVYVDPQWSIDKAIEMAKLFEQTFKEANEQRK